MGKVWLVPEPLEETKPVYQCKMETHATIEVDFMDIVEQTHVDGTVDVCIGASSRPCVAEISRELPKFLLNGVEGECKTPSVCLQRMEQSPFRAVGLPKGSQGSGKFYYEVELACFSLPGNCGIIGWATEKFSAFEHGHWMGYCLHDERWTFDPQHLRVLQYLNPSSSETVAWWDDQDVFWAHPTVFGLAVDIDKGTATITKNGQIVAEESLRFKGERIYPILHTVARPRNSTALAEIFLTVNCILPVRASGFNIVA